MLFLYAIPILLLPNALHFPDKVAVSITLGVLVVALLLGTRDPPAYPRKAFLASPLLGLMVAFAVSFVISQWHDLSHVSSGLFRLQLMALYVILYMAYRHSGLDFASTRKLIWLLLAVAVVAALEAVLQGLSFDLTVYDHARRATGPFSGAANRAGVFFAMFLALLAAVAWRRGLRTPARVVAAAGSVVLVAAILFTFSRQSYVIAAAVILLLLVRRSFFLAALSTVLLVVAVGVLPESVVQRVTETRQLDPTGSATYDPSTISRMEIWRGAFEMLADHPWGVGLGRFRDYIGLYTNFPDMDAHNAFILVLAECGPFGLAMFFWLLWRLWKLAAELRRVAGPADEEAKALSEGFTLLALSMVAGNMYGSPFMTTEVMANFWIACALIERYGIARSQATVAAIPPRPRRQVEWARLPLFGRAFPGRSAARAYTRR